MWMWIIKYDLMCPIFKSLAWQQHDVQELCRVMFDKLEETLKGTDQVFPLNFFTLGIHFIEGVYGFII